MDGVKFAWVKFYMELAGKLMPFANNRSVLVEKIKAIFQKTGIDLPKLEDEGKVFDIDPFTTFGLFNKGITDENRIKIISAFAEEFSIVAPIPTVFKGIPVLNNQKATFYRFGNERNEHDIDNLWAVFLSAIEYADTKTSANREKLIQNFDTVLQQKGIRWNITMGLYWTRPLEYINLDSKNRKFISHPKYTLQSFTDLFPVKFKGEASDTMPSGHDYLDICENCKAVISTGAYNFKNLPELSALAWETITEEVSNIHTTDEREKNFKEWLSVQQSAAGKKITPSAITNNVKAIREICSEITLEEFPKITNLFTVTDLEMFYKIRDAIMKHPDYERINKEKHGNGYLNSALTIWYEKYLKWLEEGSGVIETPDDGWIPKINEYDPGLTAENYYDLLKDENIVKTTWLDALYELYKMPGQTATCKQMGNVYGHLPSHYISYLGSAAHNIVKETDIDTAIIDGKEKYWPVLFLGKDTTDKTQGNFLWRMREPVKKAIEMLIEEGRFEKEVTKAKTQYNHNMILYGPPGTGKTYKSIIYAVAICDSKPVNEVEKEPYEETLKRYKRLEEEGRVVLTTFHQSYGYEEFIEGIKPVLDADSIAYIVEDGIFKKFCNRAKAARVQSSGNVNMKEEPRIWGMLLGGTGMTELKEKCFTNNEIRLGWSEVADDEVQEDFTTDSKSSWNAKHMVFDFINSMEIGDIVVIEKTNKTIDAIGVITGSYQFDKSNEKYPRSRTVEWLVKDIDQDMVRYLPSGRKQLSRFSLFSFDYIGMDAITEILDNNQAGLSVKVEHETRPCVFIIDEINRGNISKIFGELITLIEDTKRAGAKEAMEATLPYSGDPFSVPNNVYILGTMNTADRSIALIDTALRRRFKFIEMRPESKVLTELGVGTLEADGMVLDIAKMLDVMNERIEYLYDREHTIGHAFFTKLKEDCCIETLAKIFENEIIPLLQEYFNEDYEKIQLVLGDNDKEEEYKFIVDKEIKLKEKFNGSPDIDIPEKSYSVNSEAFLKLNSYKLIGKGL